jgi:hypothetical protein
MLASIVRALRRTALLLCLGACLGAAFALPAVAAAELSSGGIVEQANKAQEEETKTATTATTATAEKEASSSIPGSLVILALAAGGLLLGGIAFVIVRDARSVAPVVEGPPSGNSRNPEARLRKRRAQAKAARRQRKRNR